MALETPTRKSAAAPRRDIPPLTASTTRSRRSKERGSAIPAGLLRRSAAARPLKNEAFCRDAACICNVGAARLSSPRTPERRPIGIAALMARDVVDGEVVESRDQLAAWFEAGCKPSGPLRVGTEHEKIPFYRAQLSPVPYAGAKGVAALIEGMNAKLGWERIEDGGNLIGLFDAKGGGAISLEPGGQFELSGAP